MDFSTQSWQNYCWFFIVNQFLRNSASKDRRLISLQHNITSVPCVFVDRTKFQKLKFRMSECLQPERIGNGLHRLSISCEASKEPEVVFILIQSAGHSILLY
jgi:hypothetical protein